RRNGRRGDQVALARESKTVMDSRKLLSTAWGRITCVSLVAVATGACGSPAARSPRAAGGGASWVGAPGDASGAGGSRPGRPNVLILLTDDQRYDTVHALGNSLIQTPNMDRLARAGTSFTQASCQGGVNGAVCVTSRAALMTGRNMNHLQGAGDVIPPEHIT